MDTLSTGSEFSPEQRHELRESLVTMLECLTGDDEELNMRDRTTLLKRLLGTRLCQQLSVYDLPADFLLSVVIPVYNEARTIEKIIDRVRGVGIPCEIILVDDGSSDGTREVLDRLRGEADLKIIFHEQNQGKGAALRTGFLEATGDVLVIQDADMEYDPHDYWPLLQPILDNRADVVYGSRFTNSDRQVSPLWHQTANEFITFCSNLFSGLKFTDVETCYKMFRREVIQELAPLLREKRFGIEIELTAKLAKNRKLRFQERPISYHRRSYAEGKKIGWRDGIAALWCIVRY